MDNIIETAVKEKLSKGLTYPLGAQQISEKMDGIPQFSEIKLCFTESWTIYLILSLISSLELIS